MNYDGGFPRGCQWTAQPSRRHTSWRPGDLGARERLLVTQPLPALGGDRPEKAYRCKHAHTFAISPASGPCAHHRASELHLPCECGKRPCRLELDIHPVSRQSLATNLSLAAALDATGERSRAEVLFRRKKYPSWCGAGSWLRRAWKRHCILCSMCRQFGCVRLSGCLDWEQLNS